LTVNLISGLRKTSMLLVVVLLGAVLVLTGCQSKEVETSGELTKLRIGLVPGEDPQQVVAKYDPLAKYLERVLDLEVELFVGADYTETIEAMRAGKLDLGMYGPFSYILAADTANAEIAIMASYEDMGIHYESYIITHPESGIDKISDLKGKTFAFVDPASTGGYLIPLMYMEKEGINPDKDLASTAFLGGHDACALAVKNKQVDAASIVKQQLEAAINKGIISEDDFKIIHTSDRFPGGPMAWRKDLPEDLKEKIRDAFINMPEEDISVMRTLFPTLVKFEVANDSDFDILRQSAKALNLDLKELI